MATKKSFTNPVDAPSLLRATPDLYLILNPDLVIIEVTDAYAQATRIDRETALGRHLFEVFPDNPDDPNATGVTNLHTSLKIVLANKMPDAMAVQKYDIRLPESEGGVFEEHYWSCINTPVLGQDNEVKYIIHKAEDVTEFVHEKKLTETLRTNAGRMEAEIMHRAEEIQEVNHKLQLLNEELTHSKISLLEHNQELRELDVIKTEFISVVSHELRTPLTSIHGALNLILGGAVGSYTEKIKKLLDIADSNCTRLIRLVNDILDIQKIEVGKMIFDLSPVSLSKLINDSITANQMYAEKFGVVLNFQTPPKDFIGNVDVGRVLQVLANLLSNAIKFSVADGVVRVTLTQHEGLARISVIDTGCGIPEKYRHKIFKKFSQVDSSSTRRETGTGLGLAISKAIVEKLGGDMDFISVENKGSTFYFDLPILHDAQVIADVITPARSAAFGKILICEDDESQAHFLAIQLEAAGYRVDIANTAEAAKELLKHNDYAALCLDLILPDQDGVSLIKELRASKVAHKLPIIVTSMVAQDGKQMLNGEAFEVIDWLDKPVDMARLIKAIDSLQAISKKPTTKILHIEDDIDAQRLVGTLLKDTAQIIATTTLAEAKEFLDRKAFDLAILDLILPDGNGVELLMPLAKYNIPVIVLASGELDVKYAEFVQGMLLKDETSAYQLLAKIESVLLAHRKK